MKQNGARPEARTSGNLRTTAFSVSTAGYRETHIQTVHRKSPAMRSGGLQSRCVLNTWRLPCHWKRFPGGSAQCSETAVGAERERGTAAGRSANARNGWSVVPAGSEGGLSRCQEGATHRIRRYECGDQRYQSSEHPLFLNLIAHCHRFSKLQPTFSNK
jgi:hypothetical protein